uniref:Serine aminopeptidase S33 domain-containing protein n=1 Tax=Arcella intermedia TaxID=1963864 RepID=A0A6B2LFS1_9EUKA
MDSIVFPSPEPTYRVDSFKELIWVPRKSIEKIQLLLKDNDQKTKLKFFKNSIPCLYIPNKQSNICLIYSHGNACDIGEMYESFLEYSLNWKVNVIGYEYPGYGIAKGSASASNIKKDIKYVYQFVSQVLNFPPENIVFFGRSIGTGPSIYMTSRLSKLNPKQPGGLILQSPYTTIRDIAVELVGKIGNLAPKMFDNIGNIADVKCPILFIHGEQDILIPITHSEVRASCLFVDFGLGSC